MQNKKLFIIVGILGALVVAAAFVGGRLLNQGGDPLGLGMPLGSGDIVSVSIQVTPAAELPTGQPEVMGLFLERKDNSIVLSSLSLDAGSGGIAVESGGGAGQSLSGPPDDGPRVEVVTTNDTVIYLENTQFDGHPSGGSQVLQQTVAEGSLDDLTSQSFVTVWGRKSGDRIVADVLFISNPVMFNRPS
jgi:hypothetical protein